MTAISLPPSHQPEAPIRAVLQAVHRAAGMVGVPFVVIGACARDIQLRYAHGVEPVRRTLDVDLAVGVRDWEQYRALRRQLVEAEGFRECADPRQPQRLLGATGVPVDLVPFGSVSDPLTQTIRWQDGTAVMSVVGFAEAAASADALRLTDVEPPMEVAVVSLAALGVMKLVAWNDRQERRRDIEDLWFIIQHYIEPANRGRVRTGPDADLATGTDLELASARLLGRDMARLAVPATRLVVLAILEPAAVGRGHCPLNQILRGLVGGDYSRAREVVRALWDGWRDVVTAGEQPPADR